MHIKNCNMLFLSILCGIYQLTHCMEQQYIESESGLVLNDTLKKRAQSMLDAVIDQDTKRVFQYIKEGYPVKIIDNQSVSIIGAAAFLGNVEIVKALLEAYPNDQERKIEALCFSFHTTPYHFNLSDKFPQNITLNHTDYGYAPLHWACSNPETKHRENDILTIVQLLLAHGANPSYSAFDLTGFFEGRVPIEPEKALDLAHLQGLNRVADLLNQAEREKFKQNDRDRREALFLSYFADENDDDGEKEEPTIETTINLDEELFIAAKIGDHFKVKNLLAKNASPYYVNKFDYLTPLSVAANHGNYKVVKKLIKHKVDPNYQFFPPRDNSIGGPTALHALCRNYNLPRLTQVRIAGLLLAHGARTDLKAYDPRMINRHDRRNPNYEHPADLIENNLALYQLLRQETKDIDTSRCLIN